MPRGLYRFHHARTAHFITFSCYHRQAHLSKPIVRDLFVKALERMRVLYGVRVYGFVVMPEHVHLLLSEPERGTIANAMQSLKIASAKNGKRASGVQMRACRSGRGGIMTATHGARKNSSRN